MGVLQSICSKTIIVVVIAVLFSSCYVTVRQPILKKSDGTDIALYEKGNQRLYLQGSLNEVRTVGFERMTPDTVDVVRLSLIMNKFETLKVNKFSIDVWFEEGHDLVKIDKGKIYYDQNLVLFEDYIAINDSISNLLLKPMGIYSVNTIFRAESEKLKSLVGANKFLVKANVDFTVDNRNYKVHKTDTLYKKIIIRRGVSTH